MSQSIENILEQFDPVSLEDLKDYRLLNRIDTKYICNIKLLPEILIKAKDHFNIQTIANERSFDYESLYFDTSDLKTYFDHHQGKRIRYKIRFRKYIDTGDTFLEIKKKRNSTRTNKKRDKFQFSPSLNEVHNKFLGSFVDIPESGLEPSIWTIFNRITLAGKKQIERITIDRNIRFKKNETEKGLPNMIIIEVKRNKTGDISPFTRILKELNIRPFGISKYILGNILLNPDIKHNRFTNKLRTINKICYDT